MKKFAFVILMAMACMLIAGCTVVEEIIMDSPYTVDHKIKKDWQGAMMDVIVTGPADDLLVILVDGDKQSQNFIPREQMAASGKATVRFNIGIEPKSYQIVIKQSDPTKNEGKTVYKGKIDFQGGSVEIVEVSVVTKWPITNTLARVHNSGDLPIVIDYFMVYTDKGEDKYSIPLRVGPGEYGDAIVSYDKVRGGSIRVYAYSKDKVVAKFEGKIT